MRSHAATIEWPSVAKQQENIGNFLPKQLAYLRGSGEPTVCKKNTPLPQAERLEWMATIRESKIIARLQDYICFRRERVGCVCGCVGGGGGGSVHAAHWDFARGS